MANNIITSNDRDAVVRNYDTAEDNKLRKINTIAKI